MHVRSTLQLVFTSALVFGLATSAHAQATRTWVSGVGDDVNPCSRTAPCKTFAGAISKTATGGYINVLDSAGYGAVTITKSITIDGEGAHAAIIVGAGSNGIIISAPSGSVVTLRNLSIESSTVNQALNAIRVITPIEVHLENIWIGNFSNRAVDFSPSPAGGDVMANNLTMVNNGGGGFVMATGGRAIINNSRAEGNNNAGFAVLSQALMTVRNSVAMGNGTGFAVAGTAAAVITVEDCVTASNSNGISVSNGSSIRLSDTMVASNTSQGFLNDGVSFVLSLGGNEIIGNVGAPPTFNFTFPKQ